MTTVAKAAASPAEIRLGDETYVLSPLADRDIGELDNWLKSKIIQMARASLPADASAEQRLLTEQAAIAYAAPLTWMRGPGAQIMNNLEGWARIIWQGLRKNHPKLTLGKVSELLLDPLTLENAQRDWERLNVVDEREEGKEGGGSSPSKSGAGSRRDIHNVEPALRVDPGADSGLDPGPAVDVRGSGQDGGA